MQEITLIGEFVDDMCESQELCDPRNNIGELVAHQLAAYLSQTLDNEITVTS